MNLLETPGCGPKIKLEPGLLQEVPRQAGLPLKVEIHDMLLDSGGGQPHCGVRLVTSLSLDIDGALIIAEQEELAGNNVTLDYVINDNGSCTCKLCGEVTHSRTHWYRHKYKVGGGDRLVLPCPPGTQCLPLPLREM